jgi:hypothetical protein
MICCYNRTRAACSALTRPNFFIRLGHGNLFVWLSLCTLYSMSKTRAEIVNGHQMTILDCISVQSKIRAKTGRGDLERLGEVQAIEPGLLDQELVRAKCVRCPCGVVDGLHGKRSGH